MAKIRKAESGLWAVDVDGHTYEWERWGAEDALGVLAELTDLVGKPLGTWMGAKQAGPGADSGAAIARVVGLLGRKLNRNKTDVIALIKKLTSGPKVLCDGKRIDFNSHYENRLDHLFRVANAAVEVQFGDFFDSMLAGLKSLEGKTAAATP